MNAALVVTAIVLLAAVVFVSSKQTARLRASLTQVTDECADRTAQLEKVIGEGNAHPFEWDLATNRILAAVKLEDASSNASHDAAAMLRAVHPDDAARLSVRIDQIRSGLADVLLDEVRYRQGEQARWRTYVVSARANRDAAGARTKLLGLALDLSPFREAEEEATRSEHRFRELAEAMPQIVYVTGQNGRIEYANRRWETYTGLESAQSDVLSEVVHADDLPGLQEAWQAATLEGRELTAEFRLRSATDNRYRWFLTRAVPVRDAAGSIVRWYGTSTDIEDVRAANQALEGAGRRKDEFLATLAHELRNPLAPIRNAVTILQLSETHAELPWALGLIDRQLRQITRLIDDLMDVSRINEGKLALQLDTLDLRAVVQDAVEMCSDLAAAGSHTVTIDAPSEPIEMSGDAVRLAQVVANLVNNAIKYSDPGTTIAIGITAANNLATISVRDQGVGIAAEQLAAIFEMFSQIPDSVHRSSGGLGIGLSLVERLVALHGGTVHAESGGAGLGSTFTIRLPIQAPVTATVSAIPSEAPALPPQLRILLVDDNEDAVESMAALLTMRGGTVRTALHGLDVLPAAREFRPDIIVLDIGLPGADGYEVCRMIRQEVWGRALPMVALTGWGQDSDRRTAMEAGFNRHLAKPAHPDDLMRAIGELVDAARVVRSA
jgi:PAS domain S-box-containing protein